VRVLTDPLTAVFEPRRVALVGAAEQPGRMGTLFWHNLESFPGEVVPVTPNATTVFGHRAYSSLLEVDGDIDLAVIVVPAASVPDVVRDAAAKRVPAVVVISGGFAEIGTAGANLQAQLMAVAREGGVRLVGPNCLGVQNCDLPLNASMSGGLPSGGGGVTLVTQSGAYGMAIHTIAQDERTRFAKVYASGNKADISDAELLRYLGADPATRTLCFFCESLPDGRAFAAAAVAVTPHKPVIVARTGRSAAGARAALSHTGALAGTERVWRAVLEQAGVVLARSGLEMMDAARALDTQPVPAGRRVGVLSNSGGTGVELADLLTAEGLEVPELSPALQDELHELLPAFASAGNPVDITPIWRRYGELYPLLVERLARSGEVDVVVPVLLQRAANDDAAVTGVRDAVARLRADGVDVPVYVCWVTSRADRGRADVLQESGVPCFDWPERTARAVGHAVRYGAARAAVRPSPTAPTRPVRLPPLAAGALAPEAGAQLLAASGVRVVETVICDTVEDVATAAQRLGYPVVAKVLHPDITHKTDAGGVLVGLGDVNAARVAAGQLLGLRPGARVTVQPQADGLAVVVGGVRDEQFGAVVMVGLGGIHVEVMGDVAFGLAPLDQDAGRHLLATLRGYPLLTGARGADAVDLDAVADAVVAVGHLLTAVPEIAEIEINPLLVTTTGAVAVDWRIRVAFSPGQDEVRVADSSRHDGERAVVPT
jgi:acyl-CoA synthetase (NDP forming)